jgi:transposase
MLPSEKRATPDSRGVLAVEDWAEIRRLNRAEALSGRAIARRLGVSRQAVARALASADRPRYSRRPRGSAVDAFEPAIRRLLAEFPSMPASVIAERVGWLRSSSVLRDRVAQLRPLFAPPDPASRTGYDPGGLVQCDLWLPPADIVLGHGQVGPPPVLVMAAGYSRMMTAVLLPSCQAPDVIAGHWLLLQRFGAAPKALVWDNESAVGSWRAGRPKLTSEFEAFRGMLGIRVIQCKPHDPESRGWLSAPTDISIETSFLPGQLQRAVAGVVGAGEQPSASRVGLSPGGSVGHREPGNARLATGGAGPGRAQPVAAAPGLLRPPRLQRLLRAPLDDRPAGRDQR